jgi:capsular exopolysaccharide synthesis family protein
VDNKPKNLVLQQGTIPESLPDSVTVDSQVEILKSNAVALAVIRTLHLAEDREFIAGDRATGLTAEERALRVLRKNLSVTRVGLSAIIKVQFVDRDAQRAALVANELTHAYINSLIDANQQVAETASAWLEGRLHELQNKAAAAERQVQGFQEKNDIGAQAELNDLQANAKTYRKLYEDFLQRYAEAIQQQSFQLAQGRIVSPALPPAIKSWPNAALVLPFGVLGGLVFGTALALWRDVSDRTFRTPEQIPDRLGTDCIAALEAIRKSWLQSRVPKRSESPSTKTIKSVLLFAYVLTNPLSRFAEAIRGIKVACDLQSTAKSSKVVGFTSALKNEGKSVVAANFAQLIARAGRRAILVDADFHRMTLSYNLAPGAAKGLCEAVSGRAPLEEVILTDPGSGMDFVPLIAEPAPVEPSEFLSSEAICEIIKELRRRYDYIVIDFSPIASVVDVRASTGIVDSYVLVVEWGKTTIETVVRALASAPEVYGKMLGAVLNKVDLAEMRLYGSGHHEDEYGLGASGSKAWRAD